MATNNTTTEKQIHPRMKEALDNAKKAAVSNRGLYPYTKATNVYEASGSSIEELLSDDNQNESEKGPGNIGGDKEPGNPPEVGGGVQEPGTPPEGD